MQDRKELLTIKWCFPPSKNRKGLSRGSNDIKTVIVIETDLFSEPTIATSDLHSWTKHSFELLDEYFKLENFVVITAGDMAGEPVFGVDGNPTDYYIYMKERCKEFYFIQGNHDRPDIKNRHSKLRNDKSFCDLTQNKNGKTINSSIGRIGGVHGTISTKKHPYKFSQQVYLRRVASILKQKLKILVTHDTPSLLLHSPPSFYDGNRTYGNEKLFILTQQHKPLVHIYGHCHHYKYDMTHEVKNNKGVNYFNVDARILVFKPLNMKLEDLLKKDLENRYLNNPVMNDDCWTMPDNKVPNFDSDDDNPIVVN